MNQKILEKQHVKQNMFVKATLARLKMIQTGCITWIDEYKYQFGTLSHEQNVTITIYNKNFYKNFIYRGSLGAAESYINGDWSCDNLTVLIQLIIKNKTIFESLNKGWAFPRAFLQLMKNMFNYNHIKKSRKFISYHYDLSNDFFKLFLDKKMIYSCALFTDSNDDLDLAQEYKLSRICEKLNLKKHDHLLEIGTGWGALAIYAAQHYDCKVTTTTISDAQYNHVKIKIQKLNLENNITLLKKDYRQLEGQYDKLVSIEMIEAVGHQYFDKYFSICNRLLKTGGYFFLQTITIRDQEYDRYKREIDFIKAYIFPGGCLPCIKAIATSLKNKTSLVIKEINDIGKDYAKTLSHWNNRFTKNHEKIKQLGFDERFTRMFEFYFSYCEAGFLCSYISNVHIIMEKI